MQEAIATYNIINAPIILVKCGATTRASRLTHNRKQPELADQSMRNWARYLHREPLQSEYEIMDTGSSISRGERQSESHPT